MERERKRRITSGPHRTVSNYCSAIQNERIWQRDCEIVLRLCAGSLFLFPNQLQIKNKQMLLCTDNINNGVVWLNAEPCPVENCQIYLHTPLRYIVALISRQYICAHHYKYVETQKTWAHIATSRKNICMTRHDKRCQSSS